MRQHVAIYVRVSSSSQSTRSQEPDLRRWAAAFAGDDDVRWYRDKATGKTMDRPGWGELEESFRRGDISRVVVWRVDRLGRTAAGLTTLFEELQRLGVGFVSVKDSLDLGTSAGRLMANVLASVAAYEREVRGERQAAGIAAARAAGKVWPGRKKGARYKVSAAIARQVRRMKDDGEPIASIARIVGLSRPTIYEVLAAVEDGRAASSGRSRGRGLRPA